MIRNLNNKGLTAIEVLVCFALISVIVISMLNVVNNYKDKQSLESYKTSITTYKTTLTKVIYDDIILNGGIINSSSAQLAGANIEDTSEAYNSNYFTYQLSLTYKNGNNATIIVHSNTRCFNGEVANQDCADTTDDDIDYENSEYYVEFTPSTGENDKEKFSLPSIYYLKFNEVFVDNKANTNFINIHIGLWHPDFGTKYDALNIITPNVAIYSGMLGQ